MAKVGRPGIVPESEMPELVEKFRRYIEETDIPIIAEFAYQNGLWKQYFYEKAQFSDLLKIAVAKKEAALERGMLTNSLNSTGAIFSLKQLGWRDKQEIEHSGETGVRIVNDIPRKPS